MACRFSYWTVLYLRVASATLQSLARGLRWASSEGVSHGDANNLHYSPWLSLLPYQILAIPDCMLPYWSSAAAKLNLWATRLHY